MKILVYGAGVIGSYLTHVLICAKQDVSLLARGAWKTTLESTGLVIEHTMQRMQTIDHPHIVSDISDHYDIIFVAMQYAQMSEVLSDIARADAPIIVLVGNNLSCHDMKQTIDDASPTSKQILFAFCGSGGQRKDGVVYSIHKGAGNMTIGPCEGNVNENTRNTLDSLFKETKFKLIWNADMAAWCRYHLAFILPMSFLSYQCGCNLRKADANARALTLDAAFEACQMLKAAGTPYSPEGDDSWYRRGAIKRIFFMTPMLFLFCKTKIGALAISNHCQNAVAEMQSLTDAFERIQQQTGYGEMKAWAQLKSRMPSWNELKSQPNF